MRKSNVIASCGMAVALSIVIMVLGGILGLGMYVSPMLAGLCLLPIGEKFGAKYQWLVWGAVSLLSFLLVPSVEQNLMYLTLFGLYPILYPMLMKLPGGLKWLGKLLYFNVTVVAVEALVMLVLVPEAMTAAMIAVLLILGNLTFLMYDFLIPRFGIILQRYRSKLKRR